MNFFLHKLINNKKYIIIFFLTIFVFGLLYGLLKHQCYNQDIIDFLSTLFITDKNNSLYYIYLYQNIIFIIFNTYFSTSYLGFFGISLLTFVKGIQFSFSIFNLFTLELSIYIIFSVLIQTFIEFIFIIITFLPNFQISIQNIIVSFYSKDNFSYKSIINFQLNNIIIEIIILIISLIIKIYLIKI